jgi:uncharacterized membrane protein YdjX (TVP38/TMEM64 family)
VINMLGWSEGDEEEQLLSPQDKQSNVEKLKKPETKSYFQLIVWFLSTFRIFFISLVCFILILSLLVYQLPNRHIMLKFATHPSLWSAEGMAEIREEAFRRFHESWIFYACFVCVYVFFQTFSIPGSFVLNTFAGASMGLTVGLALCCVCNTLGACCCYMLSTYSWGVIVQEYFHDRIQSFNSEISKHKHNLLIYCLLLRVFPLCPCWFVNMASAFVDIPFRVFVVSVFFGSVNPPSPKTHTLIPSKYFFTNSIILLSQFFCLLIRVFAKIVLKFFS